MQKIPTLLRRDPENMRHVLPEVTPGCEWVLAGEGMATRKYDGTCFLRDEEGWWARREVKPGKAAPPNFRPISTDEITGKTVGWEPASQSPFARFWEEALLGFHGHDPGTYELCGPKINGNPEGYDGHVLVSHEDAEPVGSINEPRTVADVWRLVEQVGRHGWEGVVYHHPDGRMAKLKARDLG